MIVLTLFLALANGQADTATMEGRWTGEEMVPFTSVAECSQWAQILGADFVRKYPDKRVVAMTCGPETAKQ